MAEGFSNREIAGLLGIKKATVRYHVNEIHSRLSTDGPRSSLFTDGRGTSRVLVLLGGLGAIGAAFAIGVGALAFVLANTGEPVAGNEGLALSVSGENHCSSELLPDGIGRLTDPECAGPSP